jgi:repressor LexA
MAITKRQKEVLEFVTNFIGQAGFSPSYAEIGQALGMRSQATVHKHIQNLKNKSLIDARHTTRSIDVRGVCPTCGRGE